MFCSYIIPTIGRSSLDRAVNSVLSQSLPEVDFEVIVVNDSGISLPSRAWAQDDRVRLLHTNRSERSNARNSGAAVANGDYLAFLDDDDWILPGAMESFWGLANQSPSALWLYGGIRVVGENGEILAEINSRLSGYCFAQIMGGAWAPLQASMIKAGAFFEAGGFSPLIQGTEDEDLCRRIAFLGDLHNSPSIVACLYRGKSWETSTNYLRAPEDTRLSRDSLLAHPSAFRKLRASADADYWYGRTLKVYLSTGFWNLKKGNFSTALSRFAYGLLAAILSIDRGFSKDYWRGLRADHVPDSLHFVMLNYQGKSLDRSGTGGPYHKFRKS